MAFTPSVFGRKVQILREDFMQGIETVAQASGIPSNRLRQLEQGTVEPTGDEVLILADFYRKDFRFFIDDGAADSDKETEILFREHRGELRSSDRMAIAEFTYLCGCQAFLEREMNRKIFHRSFSYRLHGSFYKMQGEKCAHALRCHLGFMDNEIVRDVYEAMRRMGFKVFRRRLENSGISGLFMLHPEAGPCVLVNLAEGQARQRFSAAHEWGHGLLDNKSVNLSKIGDWTNVASGTAINMVELRANTFASCFLISPELLRSGNRERWTNPQEVAFWASKLRVSVPALLSALVNSKLLTKEQREKLRSQVPRIPDSVDPELEGLNPTQTARKMKLLERGISKSYLDLALDAYYDEKISRGMLGDVLLTSSSDLSEIASLFGRTLVHE